jgi:hypothetical protein
VGRTEGVIDGNYFGNCGTNATSSDFRFWVPSTRTRLMSSVRHQEELLPCRR